MNESDETCEQPGAGDASSAARTTPYSRFRFPLAAGLALLCVSTTLAQDADEALGRPRVVPTGQKKIRLERQAIERGLQYLAGRSKPSGQIGERFPVAVTALSGLAFLGAGYNYDEGPHSKTLSGCLAYLRGSQRTGGKTPGFISIAREGGSAEGQMHAHCFALLFLTQIYGELPPAMQDDVRSAIELGIKCTIGAQSRLGGWDYDPANRADRDEASVTIGALQALRGARNAGFDVPKIVRDRAIGYVKLCNEKQTGAFRYSISRSQDKTSFALTAAAVSTLHAAGVYESPELRRGIDFMREHMEDNGWRPRRAINAPFFFYGALYASQAYFQRGGEEWERWYEAIREYLVQKQGDDGGWDDEYGKAFGTAVALLILEIPVQYLPIFQR